MADKQFAGRGQSSNTWVSEEGKNLTFSVLLNPRFLSVEKQFGLNKAISLGLIDALTKYLGAVVFVKWPNDIFVEHAKIAGVLIENMVQGSTIRHSIVGIGLNVNQESFPSSLKNVTSFRRILHKDYDLSLLLADLCQSIEARYLQLRSGRLSELDADYLKHLYLRDVPAAFRIGNELLEGRIIGISENGQLMVQTQDGMRFFGNKEIEFIDQQGPQHSPVQKITE